MVKESRSANSHPLFVCKFDMFGSKVAHLSLLISIDIVLPLLSFFLRMGEEKKTLSHPIFPLHLLLLQI